MEWTIVTVIIALVGLFFTVGAPIIKLNSNITLLNANMQHNREEIAENKKAIKDQKTSAHEAHQKLWDKSSEHDKMLHDHETRIKILEKEEE